MKKADNGLEHLIRLASRHPRTYSPATTSMENAAIRAWRQVSSEGVSFAKDLSFAFMGGLSVALLCFLCWFSTMASVSSDEATVEESMQDLYTSSL